MRNPLCHRYNDCLNLAAALNTVFKCDHCRYSDSYHRQDSDLIGYWLLMCAIFYPDEYRRHFARINTRLEVKSVKRKATYEADSQERVTVEDINRLENEVFRIYKIDAAWRLSKPLKAI